MNLDVPINTIRKANFELKRLIESGRDFSALTKEESREGFTAIRDVIVHNITKGRGLPSAQGEEVNLRSRFSSSAPVDFFGNIVRKQQDLKDLSNSLDDLFNRGVPEGEGLIYNLVDSFVYEDSQRELKKQKNTLAVRRNRRNN